MVDQKVLIGVRTAEYARRADFYDHFDLIQKPVGTIIVRPHGQSPAANANIIIDQAQKHGATHIFFVDDDVHVPPDGLTKLLAHDVDVVSGLYLMRNFPHKPIMFEVANENGHCLHNWLTPNKEGLVDIVAAGLGCCLFKIGVFDKIQKPYVTLGELDPENWCDDLSLFQRLRKAGIKFHADLSVCCGHVASFVVAPVYHDGKWYTTYDTAGTNKVTIPQQYLEE
jgi:hypothetical protein